MPFSIGTIATPILVIQYCLAPSVSPNRPGKSSVASNGAYRRACQYHRHDRVRRRVRLARRVHRSGLAEQSGQPAREQCRTDEGDGDRKPSWSPSSRCDSAPNSLRRCFRKCRGRPTRCRPARSPKSTTSWPAAAASCSPPSKPTSRCSRSRSPALAQRATLSALVQARHEGGDHPRQRRRGRRRLRAAGRPRRRRAHTPDRQGLGDDSKSCLQNTRVLAIDQTADERAQKAAVAKSVTLEVDTVDAQKVWLASSVGSLSLLLRKAGETAEVQDPQGHAQGFGRPTNRSLTRGQRRRWSSRARLRSRNTPCRPKDVMGSWLRRSGGSVAR